LSSANPFRHPRLISEWAALARDRGVYRDAKWALQALARKEMTQKSSVSSKVTQFGVETRLAPFNRNDESWWCGRSFTFMN